MKVTSANDGWKDAVIDALVDCWIYRTEHEDNPKLAISDLLDWHEEAALDPRVSKTAHEWMEKVHRLELENAELRKRLGDE